MPSRNAFLLLTLVGRLLAWNVCPAAASPPAQVIAATNFPAGQQSTNGWEEIGVNLPSYNGYTNSAWGQSFIAGASGLLTTVDTLLAAGLSHPIVTGPLLVVWFYESVGGLPTVELGAASYEWSDLDTVFGTDDHRVSVDFTSFAIPITAGREYVVTYRSPFGIVGRNGSDAPFYVGLVLNNPIPFGRTTTVALNGVDWQRSLPPTPPHTFELATRVWVTPEPNSLQLLMAALAPRLLALTRRLQGKRTRSVEASVRCASGGTLP
jgi:hypothetical protein